LTTNIFHFKARLFEEYGELLQSPRFHNLEFGEEGGGVVLSIWKGT